MFREQQNLWATKPEETVEVYYNYAVGRTKWLIAQLEEKCIFTSVFEIGCCSGRALEMLSSKIPNLQLAGIDVNPLAIEFAKIKNPTAQIELCSVYDLDVSIKFDLLYSMGVFIHIPADGIDLAIDKCIEKSNRYIVHVETNGKGEIVNGPFKMKPEKVSKKFQWRPNLLQMYRDRGYAPQLFNVPAKHRNSDARHLIIVDKLAERKDIK